MCSYYLIFLFCISHLLKFVSRLRLNQIWKDHEVEKTEKDFIAEKKAASKDHDEKVVELKENIIQEMEEKRKIYELERVSMELSGILIYLYYLSPLLVMKNAPVCHLIVHAALDLYIFFFCFSMLRRIKYGNFYFSHPKGRNIFDV